MTLDLFSVDFKIVWLHITSLLKKRVTIGFCMINYYGKIIYIKKKGHK